MAAVREWLRGSGSGGLLVRLLDVLGAPLLAVSLLVGRLYRSVGSQRTPVARWLYDRIGVMPVRDHYYEPLVAPRRHISRPLTEPRDLPGVDMRIDAQLELVARLRYADELTAIPRSPNDGLGPFYDNGFFGPGDAEILHGLVRHLRPRMFVEVGSGHSTRFVRNALVLNRRDDPDSGCDHVCIEPYENPWLEQLGARVIRQRVEDVPIEVFTSLDRGDVLFIDSSHVARPQGDVTYLFQQVVPRLASGVVVHVHDVFTPRDYPDENVFLRRLMWTEQYLVEALLTHTSRLRVLLALNHLHHDHRDALAAACPVLARVPACEPGSFWLEVA